jgi:hypothetical protein
MALKDEQENSQMSTLTETLKSNLNNPVISLEFDLYATLDFFSKNVILELLS